jgi:hypothetical protein
MAWAMLLKILGYMPGILLPRAAAEQRDAMVEVDRWDEPTFALAHAVLDGSFPAQSAYLFADGLAATKGPGSLGTVETFITRAVALRDGTDPKRTATRDQDRAAMARLAERGVFTPAMEEAMVENLRKAKTLATAMPVSAEAEQREAEHQATARAFSVWLTEWREIARAVVTRRDWLIRLGLASRRKAKPAGEDPATPVA